MVIIEPKGYSTVLRDYHKRAEAAIKAKEPLEMIVKSKDNGTIVIHIVKNITGTIGILKATPPEKEGKDLVQRITFYTAGGETTINHVLKKALK